MLTKTKIVRNRVEIPIEQVLEEKRMREEKIKQNKEDVVKTTTEKSDNENQVNMIIYVPRYICRA